MGACCSNDAENIDNIPDKVDDNSNQQDTKQATDKTDAIQKKKTPKKDVIKFTKQDEMELDLPDIEKNPPKMRIRLNSETINKPPSDDKADSLDNQQAALIEDDDENDIDDDDDDDNKINKNDYNNNVNNKQLLVPGYLHRECEAAYLLYDIMLIIRYFYSYQDKWNNIYNNKLNNFAIYGAVSSKMKCINKNENDNDDWYHIFGIINAHKSGKYEWKLKILNICSNQNIMIGIVSNNDIKMDNIKKKHLVNSKSINAIMLNFQNGKIGSKSKWNDYISINANDNLLKNNDIITMELDLDIGNIAYSINNKNYGNNSIDIINDNNTTYKLAVSLFKMNQEIQIEYFEAKNIEPKFDI